jgi:hypothetical protein
MVWERRMTKLILAGLVLFGNFALAADADDLSENIKYMALLRKAVPVGGSSDDCIVKIRNGVVGKDKIKYQEIVATKGKNSQAFTIVAQLLGGENAAFGSRILEKKETENSLYLKSRFMIYDADHNFYSEQALILQKTAEGDLYLTIGNGKASVSCLFKK